MNLFIFVTSDKETLFVEISQRFPIVRKDLQLDESKVLSLEFVVVPVVCVLNDSRKIAEDLQYMKVVRNNSSN